MYSEQIIIWQKNRFLCFQKNKFRSNRSLGQNWPIRFAGKLRYFWKNSPSANYSLDLDQSDFWVKKWNVLLWYCLFTILQYCRKTISCCLYNADPDSDHRFKAKRRVNLWLPWDIPSDEITFITANRIVRPRTRRNKFCFMNKFKFFEKNLIY